MTHILNEVLFSKVNLLERIHHSKNRKKGIVKEKNYSKMKTQGCFAL